ncbi:MAG: hypothetical protein R2786_03365 [Flavobacteriaceae bacterium]
MNIFGFAFHNNDVSNISELENFLSIKLLNKVEVDWIDYETKNLDDKLIILESYGKFVIYTPLEFLDKIRGKKNLLLMSSEEAVEFMLSDTSMHFGFSWHGKRNKKLEENDFYDLESDFLVHGENRLNLSPNDDIIFDGFFPYLQKFLNSRLENEKAIICDFKYIKEVHKTSEKEKFKYSDQVLNILSLPKVKNGINEIYGLRKIFIKAFEEGGSPPKDFNMDYLKKIPEKKLRSEIKQISKEWEWLSNKISLSIKYKIIKVSLAWTFHDFKPEDLKNKWWKF